MAELNTHWTERDVSSFLFRIASDFVRHVEELLESKNANRMELAKRLGVTQGRISQVLNDPGNLTIKQIIKYARALGEKVAIVVYDDDDLKNMNGPIAPEIFATCWERAGKPTDFFELDASREASSVFVIPPVHYSTIEGVQIIPGRDLEGTASTTANKLENING